MNDLARKPLPRACAEIRSAYLEFFEARGHRRVPSSSLVPGNDPTLMFTNSGMVQFKEALIGSAHPGYRRATSAQRCVRAGGKHNDLDNVGYTLRHHTFFEMLGNFSFGDYFKEDAIRWAWEFVTECLEIAPSALWVTVHPDDQESRRLWTELIGVAKDRVVDHPENFWTMGDVGPCGPCSEIFYDHGPRLEGGPPGSKDEDGDRYVEIWNLVFPQFDRSPDGTLTALANPGVDTGMGLERIAAVQQGVHSNYDTDALAPIMAAAARMLPGADGAPLRVIADHIRSSAFLLCDGVAPSNEDRGYVLRRIIRRALRYGHQCGAREPFFHALVSPLVDSLSSAYPEIVDKKEEIEGALLREEVRFSRTLDAGMQILEAALDSMNGTVLPGEVVFKLYDTYGFPPDLTADVARGRGLQIDTEGFERDMRAQRARGRASARFASNSDARVTSQQAALFTGYTEVSGDAKVVGLYRVDEDGITEVNALGAREKGERGEKGEKGIVLLDQTPFYAESGGQIGDSGQLLSGDAVFEVADTRKSGDQFLHDGTLRKGALRVGERVRAEIDDKRRARIRLNHSATHLLHAALKEVLGSHVAQKGSLVADDRLRFDFSHDGRVTRDELGQIESMVNRCIRDNSQVQTRITSFDEALDAGAVALFGEKYDEEVRVLDMGNGFSVELCGGTHVGRTGDIGLFKIIGEAAISAGVRRIEAVTGEQAYEWMRRTADQVEALRSLLKAGAGELIEKTESLLEERASLAKALEAMSSRLSSQRAKEISAGGEMVKGVWIVAEDVSASLQASVQKSVNTPAEPGLNFDVNKLLDLVRAERHPSLVVLAERAKGRVRLVAGRSADCSQLSAREALAFLGEKIGARGGGRDDFAQSGGGDPEKLAEALASLPEWVGSRL